MEGDCGSSSSSHCEYNVYLSLTYPINSYSQFVTVGLFKKLNYEPGVLFTNGKKKRILLDFSEWNYLLIFREQLLSSMLSVSYTHLDVYKRQGVDGHCPLTLTFLITVFLFGFSVC